jgi:hypothetical protein
MTWGVAPQRTNRSDRRSVSPHAPYKCRSGCVRVVSIGLRRCAGILTFFSSSAYLRRIARAEERTRTAGLLVTGALSVVAERCGGLHVPRN